MPTNTKSKRKGRQTQPNNNNNSANTRHTTQPNNNSTTTTTNNNNMMQPQHPLPEDHDNASVRASLESCLTDQQVLILPTDISKEPYAKTVDLVKAENPLQAYIEIPTKARKNLDHHAPGWGCVLFAICIPAVFDPGIGGICFQEPQPGAVQYVAIKKLSIQVVDDALQQGKRENPYKELSRMRTLGDNIHVLGCIEALRDDKYMYIVMPYCEEESLVEWIPWRRGGMPEEQAKKFFLQILDNILYLRSHGICHRDLSPDNCMIYNGRVVLTDLAMSFRIPPSGVVLPLGGFGKPAYLPPEVYFNMPFHATGCDLWSSAVILFNLLTGHLFYEQPEPGNMMFRYFILARGLSNTPVNERTVEVLMELNNNGDYAQRCSIQAVAEQCMNLSPEVLALLEGMLRVAFPQRWTTEDIQRCAWIQE